MIEQSTRLYHCHKLKKNVHIFEDYEVINGTRTLLRCSCPNYRGMAADGRKCNGLDDYDQPCGYSEYSKSQ